MVYKFVKDYAHRVYCVVEADSLEEAKEIAEDETWEDEEGDDYEVIYFGSIALNPEDDTPIESIEVIDEGEYDEDYYWDDLEDDDFFNRVN